MREPSPLGRGPSERSESGVREGRPSVKTLTLSPMSLLHRPIVAQRSEGVRYFPLDFFAL